MRRVHAGTGDPFALPAWGTQVEIERRNRIDVAVAAYAYEIAERPIMSDDDYDALACSIDPTVSTGHARLDRFFAEQYAAYTGAWIHNHPDLIGVRALYERYHVTVDDPLAL